MEFKDLRLNIKSLDSERGTFSGYCAYKNNQDAYNDIILDGAFKRTIRNKKTFPILFMHDPTKPVGLSTVMKEDKNGLYTEGQLDLETDLGRMVFSGIKNGYIDAMSIGFSIPKGGDEIDKKGRRLIKEIKLVEYSLITKGFQANELAMVSGFKSTHDLDRRIQLLEKKEEDYMEYEECTNKIERLENKISEFEGEREVCIDPILERVDSLEEKINALADSLENTQPIQDSEKSTPEEKSLILDQVEEFLSFIHETKSVIGASDLPLASYDKEWNASEAEKRIWDWADGDTSKVKKAYFWVDGDPKEKGSYKLPFADVVDGKLQAVPRALSAVKGALNGARGGVEGIPDADKKKIMEKIDAYENKKKSNEADEGFFLLLEEMKKIVKEVK